MIRKWRKEANREVIASVYADELMVLSKKPQQLKGVSTQGSRFT